MFTTKSTQPPKAAAKKPAPARDAHAVTILTSGCHFNGKLYCRGSTRIAGKIEGQVVSEGLLVIEEEAQITAEVKVDEVIIQGRLQGKLTATSRVELCASSHVEGDIITPVLVVREGAHFNGHAVMSSRPGEGATLPKTPRISALIPGRDGKQPGGKAPQIDAGLKPDAAPLQTPEVHASRTP